MKDEIETVAVPKEVVQRLIVALISYDEELGEILHNVTLAEDEESVECERDEVRALQKHCRTALGLASSVGEYEQRCDECGCDVEEVMICPDGVEICKECFEKGMH